MMHDWILVQKKIIRFLVLFLEVISLKSTQTIWQLLIMYVNGLLICDFAVYDLQLRKWIWLLLTMMKVHGKQLKLAVNTYYVCAFVLSFLGEERYLERSIQILMTLRPQNTHFCTKSPIWWYNIACHAISISSRQIINRYSHRCNIAVWK